MPITDRSQAKEPGWSQVREALISFRGDVVKAEFGMWGGKLVDDNGKPVPPKEFMEVFSTNIEVLKSSEPLEMDIEGGDFNFRVNCSDYKGSFWVEDFLASADKAKVLIPDGIVNKKVTWKKATRKYLLKNRGEVSTTNFIIDKVEEMTTSAEVPDQVTKVTAEEDPMLIALELALGKTETQFRAAVSIHPKFVGSPLLPLAKTGAITASLVSQGQLIEVQEGTKKVYRKP